MAFSKKRLKGEIVEEFGDGFRLHFLQGSVVLSVNEDAGMLNFSGLENPKLMISSLKPEVTFDDGTTGELNSLQGLKVEAAVAHKDGSLEIRFEGSASLSVPFDVYEAWELRSERTLQIVSIAGGGVTIWL